MRTHLRLSWIAALTLLGACAPLEAPVDDAEGASRYALEPLLRPGSRFLCPALELHFEFHAFGDAIQAEVSQARQPDGTQLIHIVGTHTMQFDNDSTTSVFHCAGWVDAASKVIPVELPQANIAPLALQSVRLLPFANGTMVYGWNPNVATALWWKQGAGSAVELDIQSLSGSIGVRADQAGPVTMTSTSPASFQKWVIDATPKVASDGPPVTYALPAGATMGLVRYLDEVAPGIFAWVQSSPTTNSLEYFRTDRQAPATVAFTDTSIRRVSRNSSTGHIEIVASSAYDWDADGAGAVASSALPAQALGYAAWQLTKSGIGISEKAEPNPNASKLRIPVGYQVAWPESGAFVVRDTPSTPCSERDSCRAVAEHYLLGAVQSGTQRYGVYYAWPWLESTVRPLIVLAPVP
ncbi:MAG: hypothetical protein HY898_29900 [Deltaproteobacteria bacterium]|nr:hypothetical protein [Deltaproteobacteria bacterium]